MHFFVYIYLYIQWILSPQIINVFFYIVLRQMGCEMRRKEYENFIAILFTLRIETQFHSLFYYCDTFSFICVTTLLMTLMKASLPCQISRKKK